MNWILLIIITTSGYSDHKAVSTQTILFETKALCESAARKIDYGYAVGLRTEVVCFRTHADDVKK